MDEDTGEVIPVERTKAIVERGEILNEETIEKLADTDVKMILLQKDEANVNEYAIIYNTLQKDPTNTEMEAVNYIYKQLRNSEPPDEATARDVIDKLFFSEKRYDLGDVGRYRLNKKLNLTIDENTRGPDLTEMGVDALNPVQPECMDIYKLKENHGDKITFWGGISTQQTLPYGTPDDVVAETRRVTDALSQNGGYIIAPSQEIQSDVPFENLSALIDTAASYASK